MTGLLATEGALFTKKMEAAQADTERYRDRMNALADAQVEKFGADVAGKPRPSDNLQVYTNSPITNNPTPIILHSHSSGWLPWCIASVLIAAIMAGTFLLWTLIQNQTNPTPIPTPVPAADGDMHIEVIPGK
jgi:hypothetical protein